VVLALLAALMVGVVNGLLVARLNMTDFIVTLGSLSVVSGFTLLLTSGNTVAVNSGFLRGLAINGIGPVRWFWVLAFLVAVLVGFVLFRTRTGTYLLSTGGNIDAARGAGIHVDRIRLIAYASSGLACGIAAVLFVARTGGADPSLQTDLLLSSIAAVVLGGSSLFGGKASVLGSVAGALLLQSLINGFTLVNISQYYQPVAVGGVVLGAAFISRFQK
jgi:ribose transport system permease protein